MGRVRCFFYSIFVAGICLLSSMAFASCGPIFSCKKSCKKEISDSHHLSKELNSFEKCYKAWIKKHLNMKVSYWHFYQEEELWFAHIEVQSNERLTKQLASYAIVESVMGFTQLLTKNPQLIKFLHIPDINNYHVRLTVNGLDETGYVREVHAWKNQVTFFIDQHKIKEDFLVLQKLIYPAYSALKEQSDVTQTSKNIEMLLSNWMKPGSSFLGACQKFCMDEGIALNKESWDQYIRFCVLEKDMRLYLNLSEKNKLLTQNDKNGICIYKKRIELFKNKFISWLKDHKEFGDELNHADLQLLKSKIHFVYQPNPSDHYYLTQCKNGKTDSPMNMKWCFFLKGDRFYVDVEENNEITRYEN